VAVRGLGVPQGAGQSGHASARLGAGSRSGASMSELSRETSGYSVEANCPGLGLRSGGSSAVWQVGTCAVHSIILFVHGLLQAASPRADSRRP